MPREHIGVRHMVWQKDLGKNLDISKDKTLFDVTEESNLRIIVSPHQKRKRNSKGVWKNITSIKHVK